jgi:hypothetical protein
MSYGSDVTEAIPYGLSSLQVYRGFVHAEPVLNPNILKEKGVADADEINPRPPARIR